MTNRTVRLISYGFCGLWAGFGIFFLVWLVLASLKTNRGLFRAPFTLADSLHVENYVRTWLAADFGAYFLNSALLVTGSVLGILIAAVPAAYVLSRAQFRGRNALTSFFVVGMGIPTPLLLVPIFVIMAGLRLGDTLTGLSVIYIALSLPFSIYVLTGFFSSIPSDLQSAATIDGCSDFQTFFYVMLPLARPGVLTVALLNFVGLWNEYQLSLIMLNSPEVRTLSLGLYSLITSMQYSGADWVGLFAGVVITTVPSVLLFIFFGNKMIEGMTMGGVK
jgi:ABC-type glycerol-3-phosphate transport system permease component